MPCGSLKWRPKTKSIWPKCRSKRSLLLASQVEASMRIGNASKQRGMHAFEIMAGQTRRGRWGFPDAEGRGLYVNEASFLPEFLSVETGRPAAEGELAYLVLTTLGRAGAPVIRYRTGDLVRPSWTNRGSCRFVFLEGGIIG